MITFSKKNDKMIVEIPLSQPSYDAADEYIGKVPNLIGVISGEEYTISHLIDLGYKDTQQEGMPILFFISEEELRKVCKDFNIDIWVHDICAYCNEPMRGSFTYGDKGIMCYECELKKID